MTPRAPTAPMKAPSFDPTAPIPPIVQPPTFHANAPAPAPPSRGLVQGPPSAEVSPFGAFGSVVPPPPVFGSAPPPPAAAPLTSLEMPLDLSAVTQTFAHTAPMPAQLRGVAPTVPGGGRGVAYASPVLVDVTPRGLVVETAGGYTDTIIPRNSKIPCERTRRFSTGRDMQTTVRVRVAQGEHPFFPQNTFLGEVELSGLRPAPRGEVLVAVTFEVDADGTLRVRARDVQTGQEARATLQLIGIADESSVVMMINRFAQQPIVSHEPPHDGPPRNDTPRGPTH
jgi:molecular chaperone DnaK